MEMRAVRVVEGSSGPLWPLGRGKDGSARREPSLLDALERAEQPERPCKRGAARTWRPRAEEELDPAMCSGSDAVWGSSGDDEGRNDSTAPTRGRTARGRGRGGSGRGGRRDTAPAGGGPAAAAATPVGVAAERRAALERVFAVAREVCAEDVFRHADRSAVVQEALTRMDEAGARFWGALGLYSRRRTVLDTCLRDWPADLGGQN